MNSGWFQANLWAYSFVGTILCQISSPSPAYAPYNEKKTTTYEDKGGSRSKMQDHGVIVQTLRQEGL